MTPADESRRIELMPHLVRAIVFEKDNPNYPLHEDRVVRHVLSRWQNFGSFAVLDELCGADALRDAFFPEIPSISMFGATFDNQDIINVDIEWLGTDGAQVIISYHKEAHARMVAERNKAIEELKARRAAEYPPPAEVFAAYEKLGKPVWTPVLEPGDAANPKGSRYFGSPWMPLDAEWPENEDGDQLGFVMQINIADLPTAMRNRLGGDGIVAMFYDVDIDWDPCYDGPEDYETAAVFLRFDPNLEGGVREGRKLEGKAQAITSWRAGTDYPDHEDLLAGNEIDVGVQKFLIDTGYEIGESRYRLRGEPAGTDSVGDFMRSAENMWGAGACDAETSANVLDMFCGAGDKLAGWPAWDGGRRWLEHEGRRMALFYQIDVMDRPWEGFAFWRGDERAHIFFDEADTSVFRLAWDRGNEY